MRLLASPTQSARLLACVLVVVQALGWTACVMVEPEPDTDKAAPQSAPSAPQSAPAAETVLTLAPTTTAETTVATAPSTTPEANPPQPAVTKPIPAAQEPYAGRADVRSFGSLLAQEQALPEAWVQRQLGQARYVPQVARLMMPPPPPPTPPGAPAGQPAPSARDWTAYRARFVEAKRITAGAEYWRTHRAWLEEAHRHYGVPPALVIGILGVETYYGRITGNFRVLDALATLAFDFPTGRRDRTPFFQAQLREFLVWCQREGRDPTAVMGSYAGAIGLPQFMPGSINKFAVDFDNDGRIDLLASHADVVGSVGHYMAQHGWRRDMPTHYAVSAPADGHDKTTLLGPDIKPTFSAAQMQALGARFADVKAQDHTGPMALVELHNGSHSSPSYVAGTDNFYAVTRYNWSSYYALAVIDLGEAVRMVVEDGTSPERAARRKASAMPGQEPSAWATPSRGLNATKPPRVRTVAQAP
jgi:membrane-bound lytic murein transglycosylase B